MFDTITRRAGSAPKTGANRALPYMLAVAFALAALVPGLFAAPSQAHAQGFSQGRSIVSVASRYVGYRYRFGGASPAGFDCSGFVYYVLNRAGVPVGRNMYSLYYSGQRVSTANMQPGDLVFFSNTYKRGLSHAGIYIGGGRFINAANESTGVTVSNLWSSYWASHFTAAVRPR